VCDVGDVKGASNAEFHHEDECWEDPLVLVLKAVEKHSEAADSRDDVREAERVASADFLINYASEGLSDELTSTRRNRAVEDLLKSVDQEANEVEVEHCNEPDDDHDA